MKKKLNRMTDRSPTNIETHSYSPETEQLTVTFRGGRSYRYDGVDQKTAKEFASAGSQGGYMHRRIIGKFPHTKL